PPLGIAVRQSTVAHCLLKNNRPKTLIIMKVLPRRAPRPLRATRVVVDPVKIRTPTIALLWRAGDDRLQERIRNKHLRRPGLVRPFADVCGMTRPPLAFVVPGTPAEEVAVI